MLRKTPAEKAQFLTATVDQLSTAPKMPETQLIELLDAFGVSENDLTKADLIIQNLDIDLPAAYLLKTQVYPLADTTWLDTQSERQKEKSLDHTRLIALISLGLLNILPNSQLLAIFNNIKKENRLYFLQTDTYGQSPLLMAVRSNNAFALNLLRFSSPNDYKALNDDQKFSYVSQIKLALDEAMQLGHDECVLQLLKMTNEYATYSSDKDAESKSLNRKSLAFQLDEKMQPQKGVVPYHQFLSLSYALFFADHKAAPSEKTKKVINAFNNFISRLSTEFSKDSISAFKEMVKMQTGDDSMTFGFNPLDAYPKTSTPTKVALTPAKKTPKNEEASLEASDTASTASTEKSDLPPPVAAVDTAPKTEINASEAAAEKPADLPPAADAVNPVPASAPIPIVTAKALEPTLPVIEDEVLVANVIPAPAPTNASGETFDLDGMLQGMLNDLNENADESDGSPAITPKKTNEPEAPDAEELSDLGSKWSFNESDDENASKVAAPTPPLAKQVAASVLNAAAPEPLTATKANPVPVIVNPIPAATVASTPAPKVAKQPAIAAIDLSVLSPLSPMVAEKPKNEVTIETVSTSSSARSSLSVDPEDKDDEAAVFVPGDDFDSVPLSTHANPALNPAKPEETSVFNIKVFQDVGTKKFLEEKYQELTTLLADKKSNKSKADGELAGALPSMVTLLNDKNTTVDAKLAMLKAAQNAYGEATAPSAGSTIGKALAIFIGAALTALVFGIGFALIYAAITSPTGPFSVLSALTGFAQGATLGAKVGAGVTAGVFGVSAGITAGFLTFKKPKHTKHIATKLGEIELSASLALGNRGISQ
jgi:hypothetical protein